MILEGRRLTGCSRVPVRRASGSIFLARFLEHVEIAGIGRVVELACRIGGLGGASVSTRVEIAAPVDSYADGDLGGRESWKTSISN